MRSKRSSLIVICSRWDSHTSCSCFSFNSFMEVLVIWYAGLTCASLIQSRLVHVLPTVLFILCSALDPSVYSAMHELRVISASQFWLIWSDCDCEDTLLYKIELKKCIFLLRQGWQIPSWFIAVHDNWMPLISDVWRVCLMCFSCSVCEGGSAGVWELVWRTSAALQGQDGDLHQHGWVTNTSLLCRNSRWLHLLERYSVLRKSWALTQTSQTDSISIHKLKIKFWLWFSSIRCRFIWI